MRICTMHGAYASFEEDVKGSLTPGKLADFVILEKDPHDVDPDEIIDIGTIQGTAEAELGTAVKKSGRTTGFTTGQIQQVSVTVDVDYGAGRTARFVNQLLAGPMSQGGDSGSAVVDADNRLVGLLFAGSDSTTIMNRIEDVFASLGVEL